MTFKEIKIGGIYETTLHMELRKDEFRSVSFLVRVSEKTQQGNVAITFLSSSDNELHFLEPHQLTSIS